MITMNDEIKIKNTLTQMNHFTFAQNMAEFRTEFVTIYGSSSSSNVFDPRFMGFVRTSSRN